MLNSIEHEIYHAHKYKNANSCWHFNIYQHDKYNTCVFESKKLATRNVIIYQHFCFYEQLKFHAQLS